LTEKHRTAPPCPARGPEAGNPRTYDMDSRNVSKAQNPVTALENRNQWSLWIGLKFSWL